MAARTWLAGKDSIYAQYSDNPVGAAEVDRGVVRQQFLVDLMHCEELLGGIAKQCKYFHVVAFDRQPRLPQQGSGLGTFHVWPDFSPLWLSFRTIAGICWRGSAHYRATTEQPGLPGRVKHGSPGRLMWRKDFAGAGIR